MQNYQSSGLGDRPGVSKRPSIVFEMGYTQPYTGLKEDAKLILEGTQGNITRAILIKLQPLRYGETQIRKGFVEVWHFDNGRAKRQGRRKVTIVPHLS